MVWIISCTNKHCVSFYYNKNTDVADYNRILFLTLNYQKKFVYIALNINISS